MNTQVRYDWVRSPGQGRCAHYWSLLAFCFGGNQMNMGNTFQHAAFASSQWPLQGWEVSGCRKICLLAQPTISPLICLQSLLPAPLLLLLFSLNVLSRKKKDRGSLFLTHAASGSRLTRIK